MLFLFGTNLLVNHISFGVFPISPPTVAWEYRKCSWFLFIFFWSIHSKTLRKKFLEKYYQFLKQFGRYTYSYKHEKSSIKFDKLGNKRIELLFKMPLSEELFFLSSFQPFQRKEFGCSDVSIREYVGLIIIYYNEINERKKSVVFENTK